MHKAVANRDIARSQFLPRGQVDSLILMVTAPFLLFAGRFSPLLVIAALLVLVVPFGWRFLQTGRFTRYTPANPLIALLLGLFIPVSLVVSPLFWDVSWPRFAALCWSVALFFLVINWPASDRNSSNRTWLHGPVLAYLLLGFAVALVGLLGMQSVDKLFSISLPTLPGRLFGGVGLATNEVAGVLTLFVPFAAALCLGGLMSGRRRVFLTTLPLALLLVVTLILSQSRTGLVSSAIGLVVVALLLLRINRFWVIAGLVVGGVGLIVAQASGIADRFIFAGANSWESVIGPRIGVWTQGWNALLDFPLTGVGLGTFGLVVPWLYPQVPLEQALRLEDAHNLYLQTALDLGLLGGIVLAALLLLALVVLARRLRHRSRASLTRALAVGLFASLAAHMLYSLTDAVALGTLAGVPLWFALALAFAKTVDRPPGKEALRPALLALVGGVAVVVALVVFAGPANLAATVTTRALLQDEAPALDLSTTTSIACAPSWFAGLPAHAAGETATRDTAWTSLLDCTGRFIPFMAVLAPDDAALATQAIARQPASAAAHFWLAEHLVASDQDQAVSTYLDGLRLAPRDGRRWLALGDLLVESQPVSAEEAYLQACLHGDPGANGCLRAGRMAEQMGQPERALAIYRLSNYDGARQRADELESALAGSN